MAAVGAGRAITALVRLVSGVQPAEWSRHLEVRLPWIVKGASASILAALTILLL